VLIEDIKRNWKTDIIGYAQSIAALKDSGYPAWTIRLVDGYGVAIPYNGNADINESFAKARIYRADNIQSSDGVMQRAIVLVTNAVGIESPFASLCAELVDPGENGCARAEILASPVDWWKKWKELLGNKNIDERIYDVLGELCVLYTLIKSGEDANWNGPDGASYDIETENGFVEVKSTLSRSKREITVSNQFQLDPPGKPLNLVLCAFEHSIRSGISINGVIAKFAEMGYNVTLLNQKLEEMGFEEGMSSRNRTFILHEMLKYNVGPEFPRITPASFVGGVLPTGVTKITYTVDLSGMDSEPMVQGANHDLQNN
jgi:hypothetical protein